MAKVGDKAVCKDCGTPVVRIAFRNMLTWRHNPITSKNSSHKAAPKRGTLNKGK